MARPWSASNSPRTWYRPSSSNWHRNHSPGAAGADDSRVRLGHDGVSEIGRAARTISRSWGIVAVATCQVTIQIGRRLRCHRSLIQRQLTVAEPSHHVRVRLASLGEAHDLDGMRRRDSCLPRQPWGE